jgi:hypothetical protein
MVVIILAFMFGVTHEQKATAASGTTRAYAVVILNQTAEDEMTVAYSWEPDATMAGGWRTTDRSMVWTSTPAKTGDTLNLNVSAVKNGGDTVLHPVRVSGLNNMGISGMNVKGTYTGGDIVITLNSGTTLTITPNSQTVHLTVREA